MYTNWEPDIVPLIALQTIGFLYVAYLSIIQSKNSKNQTGLYLSTTEYSLEGVRPNDTLT